MYFVTADQPEGPWSAPTRMQVPAGMPSGLGVDNSIFIDEESGKWYLLTKAGRENNHIVELGENGQPTGVVLDLTWLNPNSEGNPYGWAEGPVMWKHNDYYYYSFAQHLAGAQYVMRSDTLTGEKSAWTIVGQNIFTGPIGTFRTPNHISPAVMLDDGTSWVIAHSYHGSASWYAQGRQGLLCELAYNEQGFPVIQYPPNAAVPAPALPSSGIPWRVPKSDMFNAEKLEPDWSFLGYTPGDSYSLTERPGWLYLQSYGANNSVIQNDGEHSFSLITRVDYEPASTRDAAGLWIINGPQTLDARVVSTKNNAGQNVLSFSFDRTVYQAQNTIGAIVWLKLIRKEHTLYGFYSADGFTWTQIGREINAAALDIEQTQFNNFTGNRQGLYVAGKPAFFDLYIYRDAYAEIPAQHPANALGINATTTYLLNINNDDWAMYAGVEFGGGDYPVYPDSMEVEAASASAGGLVEVWLDSIDTGRKIAACAVANTGGSTIYKVFGADVDSVDGRHDVYLRFLGTGTQELFRLRSFRFLGRYNPPTSVENALAANAVRAYSLEQNYPNPFNPSTTIRYQIPMTNHVDLSVYNLFGQKVATLFEGIRLPGNYEAIWRGAELASGVYYCRLHARTQDGVEQATIVKKMILVK